MTWGQPMVLAILLGIVVAVAIGVQLSGYWNCC